MTHRAARYHRPQHRSESRTTHSRHDQNSRGHTAGQGRPSQRGEHREGRSYRSRSSRAEHRPRGNHDYERHRKSSRDTRSSNSSRSRRSKPSESSASSSCSSSYSSSSRSPSLSSKSPSPKSPVRTKRELKPKSPNTPPLVKKKEPTPKKEAVASPRAKEYEWGSRSVDVFKKMEQVGEGTYGQVYKAKNKETGDVVALKKFRMADAREGVPITAIREIKILKNIQHQNVIKLKEIVTSKATKKNKRGSIYMVFEYMEHDLTGLMESARVDWFSEGQIKCYLKQLLKGLAFCHKKNVLHRDLKGSNLLINNKGEVKLADFGLARYYSNSKEMDYTNRVITLWYRPPELLLGSTVYGPAIDMWSVGCILGELLLKKPMFQGKQELEQLDLIFKMCGTPNERTWPGFCNLPLYKVAKPKRVYPSRLRDSFKSFPPALILMEQLLCLDPKRRISAEDALNSPYFTTPPYPSDPSELPNYPPSHEYTTKRRRSQHKNGTLPPSKRQKLSHDRTRFPPNQHTNRNNGNMRRSQYPNNGRPYSSRMY
eukprot:TRINITY_DN6577_c0_g1_i2.p1 TRINITY_DN6577_c0_g1~~TRINITY_DN6577_c0_g1_i2.p1  ORF type:complete len:541 (-),score=52.84 TRINITY_DN6577_c0_g1_i2:212-1834(-)